MKLKKMINRVEKLRIVRFIKTFNALNQTSKFYILVIIVLATVNIGSGSITSFFAKASLESILDGRSLEYLLKLSFVIIALYIIFSLTKIVERYMIARVKNEFGYSIKSKFYDRIQRSSYITNIGSDTTEIYYRISSDLAILTSFYYKVVIDIPVYLMSFVFFITIMYVWSPTLTLFVITISFLQILSAIMIKNPIKENREKQVYHETEFAKEIGRHFNSIETVKLFGLENLKLNKLQQYIDNLIKINIKSTFTMSVLQFITGIVGQLGLIGLLILSGYHVYQGSITAGTFIAFYMTTGLLGQPISALLEIIFAFEEVNVSYLRYVQFCSEFDTYNYSGRKVATMTEKLEVSNLTFGYQAERPILNGVNMHASLGEVIGIKGASGVGKSTLAKLLIRLYKPEQGVVKIDGTDIKEFENKSFRDQVAYFSQTPFILPGSILENLIGHVEEVDNDFLKELLSRTACDSIIESQSKGVHTKIGMEGVTLSLGEAQRIALVRTLVKKPRLVILDEPTSSLNVELENTIIPLVKDYANRFNAIVVVISHNNDMLKSTDKLYTLEQGELRVSNKKTA
ncbi:ATP-binding cassette domain-containing protein [Candidatus Contubernalis alkaliaceticus]|uniref:ATP-binding cassette domain-containing protein n=1 Tax=Candidatus Contubernalis alkaliaceticus TaxID=338645 RepID=UPI001F4BF05A|nr:ATP-binding cassette domain-containing protein [Candidatus Contubernalis alkalaceticus]UNC92827.1 ATP-binding cassette domain-containing protein [Candidatus Contubernalis alkalaceticus]